MFGGSRQGLTARAHATILASIRAAGGTRAVSAPNTFRGTSQGQTGTLGHWWAQLCRDHGRALQGCGEMEPGPAEALFPRVHVRSGAWASGGSLGSGQEQARLEVP